MQGKWSLKELYSSFDSEAFKKDLELGKESVQVYNDFVKTLDAEEPVKSIEGYIALQKKYSVLFQKLYAFCALTFSTNTKNVDALKNMDIIKMITSEHTKADVIFEKWLSSLENIDQLINSSALLKEHAFYLNEIIKKQQYKLSEKEEVLIAKMKQTGSSSWSTIQDKVTSQLMVELEVDGENKKLPLQEVRNMAYKKDADVRKKAYEAELKAYEQMEMVSASSLNSIKGEVIALSELRGFETPLRESLFKSKLTKKALDSMIKAMEESLPEFKKYFERKAKILGHEDNKLPFYDLFAPIGNLEKEFNYEEAKKFIVDKFGCFSSELSDYAKDAFEKKWIDVFPREGKRGGAFCYNLPSIKESRIMTNFTGTLSDVMTLAHELGHGFHGHALKDESILNTNYPMPLAETASIFCETIVKNAILETVEGDERVLILESGLQDASQVIVDIYSRFLFESSVFDKRQTASLSVDELKGLMKDAQKEAYSGSLSEEYLHPYMWMCKSHYYSAEFNYYNYPYAFGLLFALGLYNIYENDQESFIDKYSELLNYTGKANAVEVAQLMDVNIEDIEFWRGSLNQIKNEINQFLEITE